MIKRILIILLILMIIPFSYGKTITLLAANTELDEGSLAFATLELKTGKNRVFIENNLISKEDTQFSIRLSKDFICSNYADCESKDFLYTVDSDSYVISGPSGGVAISLLTFAVLHDLEIPTNIAMTGTINSGGYIGNIGGLKQKINIAGKSNIDKVLIPKGNRFINQLSINESENNDNITRFDLIEYGKTQGVEVIEVGTFDDILYQVFNIETKEYEFIIPDFYYDVMREISDSICRDTDNLFDLIDLSDLIIDSDFTLNTSNISNSFYNISSYYDAALNFYNKSNESIINEEYYSSASFCLSANLNLRHINFLMQPINESRKKTQEMITYARTYQKGSFDNLNDIQIYAVVEERLLDAEKNFRLGDEANDEGNLAVANNYYSYAHERARTAIFWSYFFNINTNTSSIKNEDNLIDGCRLSLKDAEMRIQYLKLYYPFFTTSQETFDLAKRSYEKLDYPLCIFYSLRSKAEADSIVSVMGASTDDLDKILEVKEKIAKDFIAKQYSKERYPILSYSYIEYGSSLRESSPYSALIYFQMAQELSNLDLFIDTKEKEEYHFFLKPKLSRTEILILGFALGIIFSSIITYLFREQDKKIIKRNALKNSKPLRTLKQVQHPRGKKR